MLVHLAIVAQPLAPTLAFDLSARRRNFALLVGLTWLAIVLQLLWQNWDAIGQTLGDSDDAMRLVQLREFLAGRPWFDLHEPRVQPPAGYDTHWSRLIDAGLAALLFPLRSIVGSPLDERLMRAIWPMLWLIPAIVGAAAMAWRLAGRQAACIVLLLLVFGLPALQQFRPGRIDHHNVQIALAVLILAAALWSDRARWIARAAGALSGAALAIGFETVPFVALAGAILASRYMRDDSAALSLSEYGKWLAAGAAAGFLASVDSGRWLQPACDAIAVNSLAPIVIIGLLMAGVPLLPSARASVRILVVLCTGGVATAISLLLAPQCAAGPFAAVEAELWPIWHSHVRELQSLAETMRQSPVVGIAIAAYPAVAALATVALALDSSVRHRSGFIGLAIAFVVAVGTTVVAIRAAPYALWIGIPLTAAALARAFERFNIQGLSIRVLASVLFTPAVVFGAAIAVAETGGHRATGERANAACFQSSNYAQIARLPPGLVLADVDYGPFLLALTPHAVLAAPYHRLSSGVLASHRAFAAPPDRAHDVVRNASADYVLLCGERPPEGLGEEELRRSLWATLRGSSIPDWLEPLSSDGPLRVYAVKRRSR
jgi:hypothetical protein